MVLDKNMGKLPKGVSLTAQGRFQARIYRNGTSVHLGVFDDVNEAAAAYRAAFIARKNSIANPPATDEPAPVPDRSRPVLIFVSNASPPEMPQHRPKVIPPGCCPNCASLLYGVVGSSDDAKKCRQCGHQTQRAKIDAHGNRMFNSNREE